MSRRKHSRSGRGELAFMVVVMVVVGGIMMVKEYREARATAAATPTTPATTPEVTARPVEVWAVEGKLPDVPPIPLSDAAKQLKVGMTKEEATNAVVAVAREKCRMYVFTWQHPFVRESEFRHYVNGSSGPTEPIVEYRWLYHATTEEQGNGDHYWGSLTAIFCGEKLQSWWYKSWWEAKRHGADSEDDTPHSIIAPSDYFPHK